MRAIFLDSETGGLDPGKHPILEIAYLIVDLSTHEVLEELSSFIKPSAEEWTACDREALRINGITWGDLEKAPEKQSVSNLIFEQFEKRNIHRKNAVFICQNPSFDRVFFGKLIAPPIQESHKWPYHWLDLASMYWAHKIFKGQKPWENGLSKDRIALDLGLPPEKSPHRAMRGVLHLKACFDQLFSNSSH